MKASGAPSKGDLVTAKPQSDNIWGLTIMGLVVGETGTRVYIKLLKHSFNPGEHDDALEAVVEHQNIVLVERAECKIVNSTSSA